MNNINYYRSRGFQIVVTNRKENIVHITDKYYYSIETVNYDVLQYALVYHMNGHRIIDGFRYATEQEALDSFKRLVIPYGCTVYNIHAETRVSNEVDIIHHRRVNKKAGR